MATDLKRIETIIITMMENRSFDHLLGYLSFLGGRRDVEGLKDQAWQQTQANPGTAAPVAPFALTRFDIPDPPHERDTIAIQIGALDTPACMRGFVQSYARRQPPPDDESLVMGYYRAQDVPMVDFFAREFAVCDHWFSALPTGTQPNRLMAMSGIAARDRNAPFLLTDQELVYDWLNQHGVSWRVYHQGPLPFFALMKKWQLPILHDLAIETLGLHTNFRRYEHFERDYHWDPTFPQVVFIEPEYTDGPHFAPNDDHPPTPIGPGQAFLHSIYRSLIRNPERWWKTVLLVTYDEHGGFFDHVPPERLQTDSPTGSYPSFETTGVRVPGFVVSPFVEQGAVFSQSVDHTAILELLADCFTPGQVYSDAVARRSPPIARLARALTRADPRQDFPAAPVVSGAVAPAAVRAATAHVTTADLAPEAAANAEAFREAARTMVRDHPLVVGQVLPELLAFVGPQAP